MSAARERAIERVTKMIKKAYADKGTVTLEDLREAVISEVLAGEQRGREELGSAIMKKAMTQQELTLDTVDAQFCSNWLKDQIKLLFKKIDKATSEFQIYGSDGCQKCDDGRITLYARSVWCLTCQINKNVEPLK